MDCIIRELVDVIYTRRIDNWTLEQARGTLVFPKRRQFGFSMSQPDTTYTCPMHPQIVRDGPGTCPICGMALEARTAQAEDDENPELDDMSRRFWVGVVLSAPLFVIAMS